MKELGPSNLDTAGPMVIGNENSKSINCPESYKDVESGFIAPLMELQW